MKTIALFGESEKGPYELPILCQTLNDLHSLLGQPPPETRGLFYAIQALHYKNQLLYIRVREEGYSRKDYLEGLKILGRPDVVPPLSAVCAPGVGDTQIIQALSDICSLYHSILIMGQNDLYDYLFAG